MTRRRRKAVNVTPKDVAEWVKKYEPNLQPSLVCAIIDVESSWNPYAWRPEPGYRWLWDSKNNKPFRRVTTEEMSRCVAPDDFPNGNQEWWGQRSSWGLMQIMGAVAREYGFSEAFFPELCDPETNIRYGCKYLQRLHKRYGDQHGWIGAVAAYNAGTVIFKNGKLINQQYVDKVFSVYRSLAKS